MISKLNQLQKVLQKPTGVGAHDKEHVVSDKDTISTLAFWSSDSPNNSHCFQKLEEPPLLLLPRMPFPLAAFLVRSPRFILSVSILESGSPSSPLGWFFNCCFNSFILDSNVALWVTCCCFSVLSLSACDSMSLKLVIFWIHYSTYNQSWLSITTSPTGCLVLRIGALIPQQSL